MKSTFSALAVGILFLTGCSSTPSAPATTPPPVINDYTAPPQGPGTPTDTQTTAAKSSGHTIGEAVKVDQGSGGSAKVTIVSANYVPTLGSSSFNQTPSKGGFLVLEILWETTSGTTGPNPFYFSTRDASGHGGALAVGTDDDLHSDPIPEGDKVAGKVAQDVGPGPWRVTLSVGGADPVFWTIPAS